MFMGLVGYSIYSTVRGARGGGKVSALPSPVIIMLTLS
jgi:hypothetical protein